MSENWSRVVVRDAMLKLIRHEKPKWMLEISGTYWGGLSENYRCLEYPAFDICKRKPNLKYDMIVAEQVWEHLLYPRRATINVIESLNPGGTFLLSVPFMVRQHDHPVDCTRWTAEGLKHFLHDCGFALNEILTWSWGNRDIVVASMDEWPKYDPLKHSLRNEPQFPYMVWGIARKVS